MKPRVPFASLLPGVLLLGALALVTAGCGGSGEAPYASFESFPFLAPERATVAPGGTVDLQGGIVEGIYTSMQVSVREGDAGGTAVETSQRGNVLYTAPATPGTYHVRVRFLDGDKVAGTSTSTITVEPGS